MRVFLIGGHFTDLIYSTKVLEYVERSNTFVDRASFNNARTSFSLCTLLGYVIYMVGG